MPYLGSFFNKIGKKSQNVPKYPKFCPKITYTIY